MSVSREEIKSYYSNVTVDKQGAMVTHTCACGPEAMPAYIRKILREIPEEITSRFYGCGSPLPPALEGCTVLDLGCGTGRDVFLASKLVGPSGRVIGVDMNADQLAVAESRHAEIAAKWGYDNVEFKQGYIEALDELGIEDGSVDVVISNCVINLSPDKHAVFAEVWRVLKEGGELYFSDIFSDRRVPADINSDLMLVGECLGGALYIEDFRRILSDCGWKDYRTVSASAASIDNPEVEAMVGNIRFTSRTVRAFKLPAVQEDICEDYGQAVRYKGGIEGFRDAFVLDNHHRFEKGAIEKVCGNTCSYVQDTRFGAYFDALGDRSVHYGAFAGCGTDAADGGSCSADGACCC